MDEIKADMLRYCASVKGNRRLSTGSCMYKFYGTPGRAALDSLVDEGLLTFNGWEWEATPRGRATVALWDAL